MDTITVTRMCPGCEKRHAVEVDRWGYEEYQKGRAVAACLPELSVGDREILLTGYCPLCFSDFFGEEA